MTLVGIPRSDGPPGAAEGVPVILAIALDEVSRRRLATLLDGVGVLMFTRDVGTARALLDGRPAADDAGSTGEEDDPVVRVGDLEVDRVRCRARWRDVPLALTKRELDLLAGLAAEPGRVWTYRQLYTTAWDGSYLDPGPVHAAVKRLRRKLREAGVPVRIEAVRGIGYEMLEDDEPS